MRKIISFLIVLSIVLVNMGCTEKKHRELRLAISPWIGYSPLYFAEEQGWLKEAGITLIHSTSLHETIHYFQASLVDAFVSTQYEAEILNSKVMHLMPLDRSNGGDVLLSNRSLGTIKKSNNITTYLEIESINRLILDDFINKYKLPFTNFKLINKDQALVKQLLPRADEDMLIVTYEPYATMLRNKGFNQIASTRDSDLFVLDSIYLHERVWKEQKDKAKHLKSLIKKAYVKLKENPEAYYKAVKSYLEEPTYEEFIQSLATIKWYIDRPHGEFEKLFKTHQILELREP